jgi:hypothetical protein
MRVVNQLIYLAKLWVCLYTLLLSLPNVQSACGGTLVIQPFVGSGIGSLLTNSMIGHAMQAFYKVPHYYDENPYIIFGRHGMFWRTYLLDVGFVFPFYEEAHDVVNIFDPANRACFVNDLDSISLSTNMELFRSHMKQIWRLNSETRQFIQGEIAKFPLKSPYVSVVIRGGDKVAMEPHLKMPAVELLVNEVLKTGMSYVHIISDSYHLVNHFQSLLPKNMTFFTTCKNHTSGFFLHELRQWTDEMVKQEVYTTFLNYELARRANEVVTTGNTNIGIWINLLRFMDQTKYSFVENPTKLLYVSANMIPPRCNESVYSPPPFS